MQLIQYLIWSNTYIKLYIIYKNFVVAHPFINLSIQEILEYKQYV